MPIDYDDREDEIDDRDERIIERAKRQIKTPAILLLVTGVISLLVSLWLIISFFTMDNSFAAAKAQWDADPQLKPEQKKQLKEMLDTYQTILKTTLPINIVLGIITAVLTIVGSIKIMNLTGKGLAIAGSILSMIPIISGCCCLGLPFGIWTLIALGKPDVKAGFAATARLARRSYDAD